MLKIECKICIWLIAIKKCFGGNMVQYNNAVMTLFVQYKLHYYDKSKKSKCIGMVLYGNSRYFNECELILF